MTGIKAYVRMEEGYDDTPYPEYACPLYQHGCESSFCQTPECPAPGFLKLVDDATEDDFEWGKLGDESVYEMAGVGCCEDCPEWCREEYLCPNISHMNLLTQPPSGLET